MKTILLITFCFLLISISTRAEEPDRILRSVDEAELLKNGNFERGSYSWKGDGDDEKLDDGRTVLAIEVHRKKELRIFQMMDVEDVKAIRIQFEYMISGDFDSNGVTMKVHRGSHYTYKTFMPEEKKSGQWIPMTWTYRELTGAKKASFDISVKPGEGGTIYFDNVSIIPID